MSDTEITRKAEIVPIVEIGAKVDVCGDALIRYGQHKAKLSYKYIEGNVEDLF